MNVLKSQQTVRTDRRVLHILSSLEPSGMEIMLLCSVEAWAHHGILCDVLSTAPVFGSIAPRLDAAGYRTFHIPFRSKSRYIPNPLFFWTFYQLCKTQRYNVIHIHTEAAPPLYTLLARLAGVRGIALTVHNTFHFHGLLRLRKSLERRLVRLLGGRYGMVSEAVAECEQEVFHNHGTLIRNWINVEQFRPPTNHERLAARESLGIPATTKVLVTVGNCNTAKNHGGLFHALQNLKTEKEVLYLHVGREEDGHPERRLAEQLGVHGLVRFCGSQADIRTYLWACDLFVMPSLYEGLGMAALEAIAAGCTVLLSEVEGLTDFQRLTRHVVFIRPDVHLLAGEINTLLATDLKLPKDDYPSDSSKIRSHYASAEGVRIICETLYGFHQATET